MQKTIFYGCGNEAVVHYVCNQIFTEYPPPPFWEKISLSALLKKCGGVAFSDSSSELWGATYFELPVIPPTEISSIDYDRIVITSCSADEIYRYLIQTLGVCPSKIIANPARQPNINRSLFLHTFSDIAKKRGLQGDVAEGGVFQGSFAKEINAAFPNSTLYLFDTFEGFSEADVLNDETYAKTGRTHAHLSNTSVEMVLNKLPHPENAVICKGVFPETAAGINSDFLFVNLDFDLYEPIKAGLELFYPRLVNGGLILIHDYFASSLFGAHKAVDEFCNANNLYPIPIGDVLSVAIVKQNSKSKK